MLNIEFYNYQKWLTEKEIPIFANEMKKYILTFI